MTAYKPKASTKHPYAAIEHRVIDSAAYIDMTFSARSLLIEITRQLSKDNNGHLQATFSYMGRHGFSENTLSRGIAELIAHGFIYRTRAGGYQQGASQYAVTWLPVTKKTGLFLSGFVLFAWRTWPGNMKKTPPPNLMDSSLKNGGLTLPTPPKSEAGHPPKTEDNELLPVVPSESPPIPPTKYREKKRPEQMAGSTETQLSLIL